MIKKLFILAFFICAIGSQAQQVSNPGFETWNGNFPANWGTFSEALSGFGATNETKTTTKNSGSFAILLETKSVLGQNIPGLAVNGPVAFTGSGFTYGRAAYSWQPTNYSFFAKVSLATGDTAFSQAVLTKWNNGTNKRDTLGYGVVLIEQNISSYSQLTVPIQWITATNPDSMQLMFCTTIHSSAPVLGTQFYLDDVVMTVSAGIQTMNADGTFSLVYPNPATSTITISTNAENAKYAQVYDLTGRAFATIGLTGKITKADVSSYENGIYIYVITDTNGHKVSTSKFNVVK